MRVCSVCGGPTTAGMNCAKGHEGPSIGVPRVVYDQKMPPFATPGALEATFLAGVKAGLEAAASLLDSPDGKGLVQMPDTIVPAHWDTDDYGNRTSWVPTAVRKMRRLPQAKDFSNAVRQIDPTTIHP